MMPTVPDTMLTGSLMCPLVYMSVCLAQGGNPTNMQKVAEKARQVERANINKSLLALGNIIRVVKSNQTTGVRGTLNLICHRGLIPLVTCCLSLPRCALDISVLSCKFRGTYIYRMWIGHNYITCLFCSAGNTRGNQLDWVGGTGFKLTAQTNIQTPQTLLRCFHLFLQLSYR